MTPTVLRSPPRWSRRRWGLVLTFVFVLEISLVYVLSWRPGGGLPAPPRQTSFQFLFDPEVADKLLDLPWLSDAAQFAQVTPRAFTAPVWEHRIPIALPWRGWGEPALWHERSEATAPSTLGTFFLRAPLPRVSIADRTAPRAEVRVERRPLALAQTTLRIEGDLRNRGLLRLPELPLIGVDNILPPSTVQVVVGGMGEVISATLQPPGSGHPPADALALDLAWKVQFESVDEGPASIVWGRLVFQWAGSPSPPADAGPNPSVP